jgi:2,4-dichlorophenol 6-monooxygenase
MDLKSYELNDYGVDLGQFCESVAVVRNGSERPEPTRDPEPYYPPSRLPPAACAGDDATRQAVTLDFAPYTTFTLITGTADEAYASVTDKVRDDLDVSVSTVIIGRAGKPLTSITTGRGSAEWKRTACSWSGRTSTLAGAR